MDQICLHLLFLSGFLSLTLCEPQEYILIREVMKWDQAQNYCRTHHLDLATVQTDEDWTTLREIASDEGYYGLAWFGLYNDINSWRWSYNEEALLYKFWSPGQPNNVGSGEECVAIYFDGTWYDFPCVETRNFVCIDETANATEKFVLVKTSKTWVNAQKYCRLHHSDLATIRNQNDNVVITNKLNPMMSAAWIGLYRDTWKWSDQANITSSTELAAQNLNGASENCAAVNYYKTIEDYLCTSTLYSYCSTVRRMQQVVRVKVYSGDNSDDVTLSALVLDKLQQTLDDEQITLTWRTHPNGKIFQKAKTIRKSANVSNPVC